MATRCIDGSNICYTERGKGPAVVLLHGFPLDSRIWAAQLDALSDRFRVITPDFPGFGESGPPGKPFTLSSLADDLYVLLEDLGAIPCVLGGLSMGGYVALSYVKKYPTSLRGLMLIDTRAEGDSAQGKEARMKMVEAVRAGGSKAAADQMEPKMLAPDTLKAGGRVVRDLRTIMEACPPKTIENALLAMRDREDHTGDLPSIPVPTLIVVGEADAITPPATAQAMQREISNSQLEVIPGAGHLAPMEQPEHVSRAIRGFVQSVNW